jgi:hypothetical protein
MSNRTENGRFAPGASGNPSGVRKASRANGSREEAAVKKAHALLLRHAGEISAKALDAVLSTSKPNAALIAALLRVLFPPAERAQTMKPKVTFAPPQTAEQAQQQISEVAAAIASGALDHETGKAILSGLESFIRAVDVVSLEKRISDLENQRRGHLQLVGRQP